MGRLGQLRGDFILSVAADEFRAFISNQRYHWNISGSKNTDFSSQMGQNGFWGKYTIVIYSLK